MASGSSLRNPNPDLVPEDEPLALDPVGEDEGAAQYAQTARNAEQASEQASEEEGEAESSEEAEEREKKKRNILQRLHTMTPAQKIVLAQKGNKTVRMTLIRDANRVVATAAIKNPGISESEIIGVATSRARC